MRGDVRLEIYGTISDPELLRDIVDVAIEQAKGEWSDFIAESDEDPQTVLARYIGELAQDGYPLSMDIDDTRYGFDDLRAAIRASSGVGYRLLTSSERLGFDYAYSFQPGWDAEREGPVDHENSPSISYGDLREAMSGGIEAVERLVKDIETACLLPADHGVVLPEDVYLAWESIRAEDLAYARSR